jgi:hypothetical protein
MAGGDRFDTLAHSGVAMRTAGVHEAAATGSPAAGEPANADALHDPLRIR